MHEKQPSLILIEEEKELTKKQSIKRLSVKKSVNEKMLSVGFMTCFSQVSLWFNLGPLRALLKMRARFACASLLASRFTVHLNLSARSRNSSARAFRAARACHVIPSFNTKMIRIMMNARVIMIIRKDYQTD